MNKKAFIITGVLVAVGVFLVIWYIFGRGETTYTVNDVVEETNQKPNTSTQSQENLSEVAPAPVVTPEPTLAPTPPVSQGRFSDEEDIEGIDVQVHGVSYDGKTFSPATISIKLGDIITFENTSGTNFQPVGDGGYTEFDAETPHAKGERFDFKFTKLGTWAYHDALNASAKGVVKVTK